MSPSPEPTSPPTQANTLRLNDLGGLWAYIAVGLVLVLIFYCCWALCRSEPHRVMVLNAIGITTPTMTPELLDEIGEYEYRELSAKNKQISDECSICLNSFESDEICRELPSPCSHCFHKTCIDHWFTKSIKCPLCSRSIFGILTERKELEQRLAKEGNAGQIDPFGLMERDRTVNT